MNKIILRELEKIKANMSSYDDSTTLIHIDKREDNSKTSDSVTLKIGTKYRFMVQDYILKEPQNFSLSSNWNNGVIPVSKYMEGTVTNIQGNMIQFNSVGFDVNTNTEKEDRYLGLWLPRKSITVLGEYRLV